MKQVTGPTRAAVVTSAYREPRERDGCHNCMHAKPELKNSRLRCARGTPMFVVNKMGWCPSHKASR